MPGLVAWQPGLGAGSVTLSPWSVLGAAFAHTRLSSFNCRLKRDERGWGLYNSSGSASQLPRAPRQPFLCSVDCLALLTREVIEGRVWTQKGEFGSFLVSTVGCPVYGMRYQVPCSPSSGSYVQRQSLCTPYYDAKLRNPQEYISIYINIMVFLWLTPPYLLPSPPSLHSLSPLSHRN